MPAKTIYEVRIKMANHNIIPQGEQARFIVKSNRADFSFEDSDYSLEIIYGMNGAHLGKMKDSTLVRFSIHRWH